MINFKAIRALYPSVVTVRGDIAYDKDENIVDYDLATVNAWVDPEAYIAKRQAEYPTLADFADAYYWSQNGDNTKMTAYIEKCNEIKSKYPKPE